MITATDPPEVRAAHHIEAMRAEERRAAASTALRCVTRCSDCREAAGWHLYTINREATAAIVALLETLR